ncbi:MAG: glycosyltransferase family 61 protein [Opitutaceae bacterium]
MSAPALSPVGPDHVLCPEFVSRRPVPENLEESDRELFSHELTRVIPPSHLLDLENVNISPHGILFRNGRVRPETFAHEREAANWQSMKKRAKLLVAGGVHAPRNTIEEDAFWVTDSQSSEFFHWMADALPRLLTVKDRLPGATLLLPEAYAERAYIRESLASFDIGRIRFVDQMTRCRRLLIPTSVGSSGNYNDELMQRLRAHLAAHFVKFDAPVEGGRFYISRARAPKRKLHNETEAVEVLEGHDFRPVCFEDHPFSEQLAIAMKARHFVSNHGAGLTNMLLMPAGGRVLELRKEDDAHNNCYFALAAALGLRYFYQLCPARVPDEDAFSADLIVNPAALDKTLRIMLDS